MTKRLPEYTYIDGHRCVTETNYKGYKIYKTRRYGIERYSVLVDGRLKFALVYLKYAKQEVDNMIG